MDMFTRALMLIFTVLVAVMSVLAVVAAVSPAVLVSLTDFLEGSLLSRQVLFIFASILLILSLTSIFIKFRNEKDNRSVTKLTNIGEIRISLNAVESIALAASKKAGLVKETRAHVEKAGEGVAITIRAIAMAETNLPSLFEDIQARVKSSVEEHTGIHVNDVKVVVENVYTGYRSRVE